MDIGCLSRLGTTIGKVCESSTAIADGLVEYYRAESMRVPVEGPRARAVTDLEQTMLAASRIDDENNFVAEVLRFAKAGWPVDLPSSSDGSCSSEASDSLSATDEEPDVAAEHYQQAIYDALMLAHAVYRICNDPNNDAQDYLVQLIDEAIVGLFSSQNQQRLLMANKIKALTLQALCKSDYWPSRQQLLIVTVGYGRLEATEDDVSIAIFQIAKSLADDVFKSDEHTMPFGQLAFHVQEQVACVIMGLSKLTESSNIVTDLLTSMGVEKRDSGTSSQLSRCPARLFVGGHEDDTDLMRQEGKRATAEPSIS